MSSTFEGHFATWRIWSSAYPFLIFFVANVLNIHIVNFIINTFLISETGAAIFII